MKRNILLAALVLILAGCNHEERQIRQAALGYINAMSDYDFERAKAYATPEAQEATIDYFRNEFMPRMTPQDREALKANTPATIDIHSIVLTTDTTAIVTYYKTTPIAPRHQDPPLPMRKRNGQWLAHMILRPINMQQPDTTRYDSIAQTLTPIEK